VTALTVQNTVNVSDFRVLDREWVLAQANAVLGDSQVAAVKLGMLGSTVMVDTVVELLQQQPHLPVVCDPVLRAGGGGSLGKDEVGYAMRERLLPLSLIATPNLPEARILAELPEGTADECAEKLLPFIKHLLITGGHGDEHEVHNRLYSRDGTRRTFTCQRLPGSYHGSGCTLASALAGRLAQGEGLASARGVGTQLHLAHPAGRRTTGPRAICAAAPATGFLFVTPRGLLDEITWPVCHYRQPTIGR
jgi:hydroxymethylpyrimidine/phosphomethylpyrimidine kinase